MSKNTSQFYSDIRFFVTQKIMLYIMNKMLFYHASLAMDLVQTAYQRVLC